MLLFERSSRPVTLTAAGRALLPKARAALAAADEAYQTAVNAARGAAGVLRIGVSPAAQETAAPILRELTLRLPKIELQVEQDASGRLVADLCGRRLDLLIGASIQAPPMVRRELVRLDDALLAVHPKSIYANLDTVALADLRDATFVIARDGIAPGYNEAVIGFCLEAGFSPRTVVSPALMAPPELPPDGWVIIMSRAGIKVMQLDFDPVWLRIDPPHHFRIELAWHPEVQGDVVELFRSAVGSVAEREQWIIRVPPP